MRENGAPIASFAGGWGVAVASAAPASALLYTRIRIAKMQHDLGFNSGKCLALDRTRESDSDRVILWRFAQ